MIPDSQRQSNSVNTMRPEGKMLVTGASGFVGRALCAALARRGFPVRAAVRGSTDDRPAGCECVHVGSLSSSCDWTAALSGVATVIHLAARAHVMREIAADPLAEFRTVNVAGTERLARQAAQSGVKRLVFVSSIKVNGERTSEGQRFSEADSPCPQDAYGMSKWEAEQALRRVADETGLDIVVVRPPLVYGPGVKGNFATMLKVLHRGIPLPLASVRNRRSLLFVGNLADALIRCATHPAAAMQTYLVSDGEDLSTPELLRRLGSAAGKPARLLPCPAGLLRLAGKMTGKSGAVDRLLGSLQVDSGKIRRELGWSPPYPVDLGLKATIE